MFEHRMVIKRGVQERCKSVARAFFGSRNSRNSVWERCKTFCGFSKNRSSVQEHCRSWRNQKSEPARNQLLSGLRVCGSSLCNFLTGESFPHKSFMVGVSHARESFFGAKNLRLKSDLRKPQIEEIINMHTKPFPNLPNKIPIR